MRRGLQAKQPAGTGFPWRLAGRLVVTVCVALMASVLLAKSTRPDVSSMSLPGFGRGLLHGALMPCALPALLLGRDVGIYATENDGRPYKIGYTAGVNLCGAVFFGFFYWRLNWWRVA